MSQTSLLSISDAVIWQETANGVSIYHTETGEFRSLNPTAAQIWALVSCDGERESIITRLSLLFAGRSALVAARVRADVTAFLDGMVDDGLLAETGAAAP